MKLRKIPMPKWTEVIRKWKEQQGWTRGEILARLTVFLDEYPNKVVTPDMLDTWFAAVAAYRGEPEKDPVPHETCSAMMEEELMPSDIPDDTVYMICRHCDHFVDKNDDASIAEGCAEYSHLEDGEQEFDHDAEPRYGPSCIGRALGAWKRLRPDLFKKHPDGKIGPNSILHHSRRGKSTSHEEEAGEETGKPHDG